MGKIEEVKEVVWKNMPERVKPYIRYAFYASQIPFSYKGFNTFKYVTSVGKEERINFIPPVFIASICTVCNLKCPNCLYVLKDTDVFKGGGFIKVDDFKTVIDKYAKGVNIVWLTGGGTFIASRVRYLGKDS